MPKKRIPSSRRQARKSNYKPVTRSTQKSADSFGEGAETCLRFIGVSLSGGKADKASVAVIEYYPAAKKMFLARLIEKIKTEEFISADLKIHEIILQHAQNAQSVAFDVPLNLPHCVQCKLKCPGYEACNEDEIKYILRLYQQDSGKRKPKKMYTPYTQRALDTYLAYSEPDLDIQHALGANMAPLTARGIFIAHRLQLPLLEVFPKLSVWRLGARFKVNKTHLKTYRNSVGGDEARATFLKTMVDQASIFFYEQDVKSMVENTHAFDAMICAFTGYLEYMGETQSRPKDLPKSQTWAAIPQ